jgi:hypothetical protein
MRRGQWSAGALPAQNRWPHIVLSRVGEGGAPAIQGLASGGRGDSGPKGAVGPSGRPAPIPRESGPSQPLGGSLLPHTSTAVELCGNHIPTFRLNFSNLLKLLWSVNKNVIT